MARKVSIPHVAWRNGRPRFEPSATLRNQGHRGHDLKDAAGTWMSEGQALDWSRAFTARLKGERKAARMAVRVEKEANAAPLSRSYTVASMMIDWLGSVGVAAKSANTVRDYRQKTRVLENYHLWILRADAGELGPKEKPPTRADRAVANIWSIEAAALDTPIAFTLWEELYRRRGNHTANAVLTCMGMAFTYAQKKGKVDSERKNPCYKLGKVTPKSRPRFGSPDEIEALIAAADEAGRQDVGDMIALGVWIGQRQGDRLALRMDNIRNGRFVLGQSKTAAGVSIAIAPALALRLEASARRRKAAQIVRPHVVVDEHNRTDPWSPFRADHYRHLFAEIRALAAAKVGSVTKLRDKDLRATAVLWLAQAGCTPTQIASISGHSLVTVNAILKHYWEANAAQADDAMAKLVEWHKKQGG